MNSRSDTSKKRRRSGEGPKRSSDNPSRKMAKAHPSSTLSPVPPSSAESLPALQSMRTACRAALVVLGTYQGLMIGLVLRGGRFYMKFSTKHHVGSVNSIAVTDRVVASSGTDERLFLFTNKLQNASLSVAARRTLRESGQSTGVRMADLGSVTPPSEITCMQFTTTSQFLYCGGVDGHLLGYRARDWSVTAALEVHEKRVTGVAVHPKSDGALVVTVGADRMVAVLDMTAEQLLTKWKYLSSPPARESTKRKGEVKETGPVSSQLRREEPQGVAFSASGDLLLVHSVNAFQIWDGNTMKLCVQYQNPVPQPADEMHAMLILEDVGEETLLLMGDESGRLRCVSLTTALKKAAAQGEVAVLGGLEDFAVLTPRYPEAVDEEAQRLLATPVQADMECRRKTPLRHVSRLKSLCREGMTLFTLDARGIVLCWDMTTSSDTKSPLTLTYVASANCQGRATSMATLWL